MEHENPYTLFQIGELVHVEWTALIYVFVLFLFTVFWMNKLLFKPIIKYVSNFDDKEKALNDSANKFRHELKRRTAEFEDKKKLYFEELKQQKEQVIKEAKNLAFETLNKTRTETKTKSVKQEEELLKEVESLKNSINSSAVDDISSLIPSLKKIIISKIA